VLLEYSPYTPLLLLSGGLTAVAGYFAWRSYPEDGAVSYLCVMGTNTVLAPVVVGLVSVRQQDLAVTCLSIVLLGMAAYPIFWIVFGYTYTGHREWLTRRKLAGFGLIYVAFAALVATNAWHELVYVDPRMNGGPLTYGFGPAFWVMEGVLVVLVVAGSVRLFRHAVRSRNIYRRINFLNAVGGLSVLVVHELDVLGVTPTPVLVDGVLVFTFWGLIAVVTFLSVRFVQLLPIDRITAWFGPGSDTLVPIGRDYVLEDIDDGVIILDGDGTVVDINSTAKLMFGRGIIGDDLCELPDIGSVVCADGPSPDLTDINEERWIETPEGERYFKISVSDINAGTGTAGYVCLLQDMTDLKKREETVGLLKDTMSRFLRHNIRNDMNVARARIDMLGETIHEDDDRFEETVETALERIDKIVEQSEKARYVERVVESARTVDDLDIAPSIERMVDRFRRQYRDVVFETDVDDPLWVRSSGHIETAIENLVVNAIEHNDADRKEVRITAHTRGDCVEVIVADNGPGIPDHEIDVLQEREETDLRHGSGFGLWLVDWILDHSDGEVSFESDDDGTSVYLTLDRGTPETTGDGTDTATLDESGTDTASTESVTRPQD
jgi:signal transduction histidine kinase